PSEVEFILNRMSRPTLTPHTQTRVQSVLDEISLVQTRGYSINDEELELGLRSIAVPIRNGQGELIAAMSLSVSTSRMTRQEVVDRLLPELENARRNFATIL
ncbi:MAG: IclR family transcriptional regulator C-terminal domain-containing protein, partial [Pseudomonadota bacterium]